MTDDELQAVIDEYKAHVVDEEGVLDERVLRMLVKEVERRTRHRAVRMAYDLAARIDDR